VQPRLACNFRLNTFFFGLHPPLHVTLPTAAVIIIHSHVLFGFSDLSGSDWRSSRINPPYYPTNGLQQLG
jgi:hypothetical protein